VSAWRFSGPQKFATAASFIGARANHLACAWCGCGGYHCEPCVRELDQLATRQRLVLHGSVRMDRVRELLFHKRAELRDRWDRQLRAAAEAGFPLDQVTSDLLPQLLEAAGEALEKRFRLPVAGTPAPAAGGRRAAVQGSLLADFLFDAMLEHDPSLSAAEQRRLSDSLAHAAIEVLVRQQLEGELDRRRRDADRFTRVGHQLRNSMTAASSRWGSCRSAARCAIRARCACSRTAWRACAPVSRTPCWTSSWRRRAAPVAHQAGSRGGGSAQRYRAGSARARVQLVLDEPSRVEFNGDTRLMRAAVRALVRVALDLSRRGATVRMQCAKRRQAARLAVVVDRCRKRPDGRLGSVSGLALVRRAARAHGGEVRVRTIPATAARSPWSCPHPDA